MDKSGQEWTRVDKGGQGWTRVDESGLKGGLKGGQELTRVALSA